jgi:uncharacterized membrane protein YccC
MMIEAMKQWAEGVSKAYDLTAWGHSERAAEILRQTRDGIRTAIKQAEKELNELARLQHNNAVLMDALWKSCGDDEETVNATIESKGKLK